MGACRELTQVIREIIRRIKEFDFGAILDDIGALKMPFLGPYWPEVRSFPRYGCFAVLHAKHLKTEVFCPVVCEQQIQFTVYKKSRRVHRPFKFSQKSHTHQVLTLPERIPQFTVMRPAVSTTIDQFGRSQYHIYLCTQAGLLSNSASVRVRGGNHVT